MDSERIETRTVDYDDWVDAVNASTQDYFDAPDVMELDFDFLWDEYEEINANANLSHKDRIRSFMKRQFMSYEHLGLNGYLAGNKMLSTNGVNALLDLKMKYWIGSMDPTRIYNYRLIFRPQLKMYLMILA